MALTEQDAFNKIYEWFSDPSHAKSYDAHQMLCKYRDDHGNKCAIGVLIPDELYDPAMENMSLGEVVDRLPSVFDDVNMSMNFLLRVQHAHDDAHDRENVIEQLQIVADGFQLEVPA